MSNEAKKYNWFYGDNVQYTVEEYISKIHELISSATNQMQECDGDLFMSEYQKLIQGAAKLSYLNDQMGQEKVSHLKLQPKE
jgi:hypothetical protein